MHSIALYLHIPWCVKKCPYCDFNSHVDTKASFATYFNSLAQDLEQSLPLLDNRKIGSVFIGGGTPSLVPPEHYQQFFTILEKHSIDIKNCEITIEANPGTLDNSHLEGYLSIGINRLSLGIQSFDDLLLQKIGRIHSGLIANKAIEYALQCGFENINLDLMYGLPGQTVEQALNDLRIASQYPINHLSWYNLTIEPNTAFYSAPPQLPNDDVQQKIYYTGNKYLESIGMCRYEISAFCKPNMQSQHNLNYWQYGDYLGLGAGAHSKISNQTQIIRFSKKRQPEGYMRDCRAVDRVEIKTSKTVLDVLINCLRLIDGFCAKQISMRCHMRCCDFEKTIEPLFENGYLEKKANHWYKPTVKGIDFQNEALLLLL